jgi:hypothetical protein
MQQSVTSAGMTVLVVIEAVVLALLVVLVAGLLRSHAEILRTLHDAGVGRDPLAEPAATSPVGAPALARTPSRSSGPPAAAVAGTAPGGDAVVVGIAGADRPTLLAFLSSGCITCRHFWETFATPGLALPGGARLVVVTMGPEAESESAIAGLAPAGVPVVMSSAAWTDYDVPGSPFFVFVDGAAGEVVGQGTAPDWDQAVRLMTEASDDIALAAGDAAATRRDRRAARRRLGDRAREARTDEILMSAGIYPGHPSLYADPEPDHPEE